MSAVSTSTWDELFQTHERFLWGLCYRLTGNAADADDLVQETFVRALKHPPARTDEPWRPWLVRVAVNLGRDLLRHRRRQPYEGAWLPAPIETGHESAPPAFEPADAAGNPAARYDMLESVSFAFLLALEALTPLQRAVLLLRDVFDYSLRETAAALGVSEANVKTTHLRARRAMRAYEQARCVPTRSLQQQAGQALERFLQCLRSNDVSGIETLLVDDVCGLSDGGGEFHAARKPIAGRDKVLLFYRTVVKQAGTNWRVEMRFLNGLPALVTEALVPQAGYAPRTAMLLGLDAERRINRVYSILATRKLKAVRGIEA
ncbi:MAG: sigma-70 family RNA polymerase sigma factor [Acidobacteria bacterium]|nr:sigma-70 family RNA polymerase sigma factor [Acidobacteriota bacterium]MBI3423893.1 sigma-70 family RNA polymerase sigma factor [Acidobacteriota bacterium]